MNHRNSFVNPQKFAAAVMILMLLFAGMMTWSLRMSAATVQQKQERYELKGTVRSVDKEKRRATIQHEKIGDYMGAMTMPFLIKDDRALGEMQAGDQIKATLVVTEDGGQWVEKVTIVAKAKKENKSAVVIDENGQPSVLMGVSGDRTPPPSRFDDDGTGLFTCPMHLNYRSNKPGKCPRCGMELISTEPGIPEEFNLEIAAIPKLPQPGQPLKLHFSVYNPRTAAKVKEFGLMHDKLFHLFLVSQDLNDFQHIHPRQLADGSFVINTVLKQPGLYKVYSDIYPLKGAPQVLQSHLAVAGWKGDLLGGQARLTPDTNLAKLADSVKVTAANAENFGVDIRALEASAPGDLKVELTLDPSPIICGRTTSLKYKLTDPKTGEPVHDIIPYLGAWGHTLILSEDQNDAVHSHPEEQIDWELEPGKQRGGPDLTFDAFFPAPGNYRVWTQFLRGDKLSTVTFDLRVERLH